MKEFRLANLNDLDELNKILIDLVENKHEGFGWTKKYPNREIFKRDIENGEFYVLVDNELNSSIVGGVVLNKDEDINYKNIKWSSDEEALVIHRLFTSYKFKGSGYGKIMMDKIKEKAKKESIEYIRLDTFSKNVIAQNLYKKEGFKYMGNINLEGKDGEFYCFEFKVL
ncbi:GNAT family N-acetyltransferase [Clostridium sp.]|uniref:GNAT family N-acetyltransferase n=1 Tax=Clostridium sp. TaxID=1506 RepID=UPI003F3B549B